MMAQPFAKMMKMAPPVETALMRLSIFAALIIPIAHTRKGDLAWRVCGIHSQVKSRGVCEAAPRYKRSQSIQFITPSDKLMTLLEAGCPHPAIVLRAP